MRHASRDGVERVAADTPCAARCDAGTREPSGRQDGFSSCKTIITYALRKIPAKPLDRGQSLFTQCAMLPETVSSASPLQPGQPAPGFDLPDADMNTVSLEGFRNRRNVVLYFYPKDDTPGCTMEAIDFGEIEDVFGALTTVVLGVSMDDCLSHGSFRDKHGLSVQLLADVDGVVCRLYGVLQDKEGEGRRERG